MKVQCFDKNGFKVTMDWGSMCTEWIQVKLEWVKMCVCFKGWVQGASSSKWVQSESQNCHHPSVSFRKWAQGESPICQIPSVCF